VGKLEESTKPSFADWANSEYCVSKIIGLDVCCPRRSEQGTVHMAQLLVPAVSRTIGALLNRGFSSSFG
jgi:hypothetical protein